MRSSAGAAGMRSNGGPGFAAPVTGMRKAAPVAVSLAATREERPCVTVEQHAAERVAWPWATGGARKAEELGCVARKQKSWDEKRMGGGAALIFG
jgi:hypothetical protein